MNVQIRQTRALGNMLARMTPTDCPPAEALERLEAAADALLLEASAAADALASELRVRVITGTARFELDDPALLALDRWNSLDLERATLVGAIERLKHEATDRLARVYGSSAR